jgi:hypothetical protein
MIAAAQNHLAPMTMQDRIASYETAFPNFPTGVLHISSDGRVSGTFVMGQNFTVKSTYYGGYPHGYLKRMRALFPDKTRALHLFSGKVDIETFPGDTVDINNANAPTYVDDAQTLLTVPLESYDIVLADPPYSVEDCDHYQTTMVKRNVVMKALQRLPVGAHVVWLDQVLPVFRKSHFAIRGVVGMVKSTNHRFRVITIFERVEAQDEV